MKSITKYGFRYPLAIVLVIPLIMITLARTVFLAIKSRSKSDEEATEILNNELIGFFAKFVLLFSWAETGI